MSLRRKTVSLTADPPTAPIPWQVGDRIVVKVDDQPEQAYRVIFVAPQQLSLEAVKMSDVQQHLERLRTNERHERAHAALMQQPPPPDAQWSATRLRRNAEIAQCALEEADTLAFAIHAIEERDELLNAAGMRCREYADTLAGKMQGNRFDVAMMCAHLVDGRGDQF